MSLSAAPLIDCEVNSIYYCGEWWNKRAKRSGTSTLIKLVKIRSWPALSSSFMRKSTIDLRGANLVNVCCCCCCCCQVARAHIFYFDFIGMLIWIIVSSWPSFRYVAAFMRTQWNFMFLCGALMGQFSDGDRKKTHTREIEPWEPHIYRCSDIYCIHVQCVFETHLHHCAFEAPDWYPPPSPSPPPNRTHTHAPAHKMISRNLLTEPQKFFTHKNISQMLVYVPQKHTTLFFYRSWNKYEKWK